MKTFWPNATVQQKVWSLFLLIGFLIRLFIAWSDVPFMLKMAMPDDAFYYFQIAQRITLGEGSTFDGLTPTNGYHPLWMAILVPIYWLFGHNAELPIHIALSLASVLDLISAIFIYRIVSDATKWQSAGLLASTIYFLNPYSILATTNGLETTAAALLFVLSIWWYEHIKAEGKFSWHSWALLGGFLGFLLLARTDYIFFVAALNVDALLRLKPLRQKVKVLVVLNSLILLTLVPWLSWNLVRFGSIMQVSGAAYPYYQHTIRLAEGGGYWSIEFLEHEGIMGYMLGAHLARLSGIGKILPFLVVLFGLVIVLDKEQNRRHQALNIMGNLVYVVVGISVSLLVHSLWRWMILPWYFAPVAIVVALYAGFALYYLGQRTLMIPYVLTALLLAFYGIQYYNHLQLKGWFGNETPMAPILLPFVQEMCEHEEIIGISDSGYLGYYANCTVVNLDGVVNNQAFLALKNGTFVDYLQENGMHYVILNEHILALIDDDDKDRLIREGRFWKVLPERSNTNLQSK